MKEEELYKLAFKPIYRFLFYKDVPTDHIEDLCQETFFRFFTGYECESLDQLSAQKILYSIARNVYREWVRAAIKSHTLELPDDLAATLTLEEVADPEFEEEQDRLRALLKEAVEELSPKVREVIKLRCIEGLTRKEVGERLGMKEKHVHIYQQRGIKMLAAWCERHAGRVSPLSYTE